MKFPDNKIGYKSKRMKRIDLLWEDPVLTDSNKSYGLLKAGFEYFIDKVDDCSYEAKEAALKALGKI